MLTLTASLAFLCKVEQTCPGLALAENLVGISLEFLHVRQDSMALVARKFWQQSASHRTPKNWQFTQKKNLWRKIIET